MITPLAWTDEGLSLLDQTRLPGEVTHRLCTTHQDVVDAIRTMQVRGAPAIGIAAAYGVVLAVWKRTPGELGSYLAELRQASEMLRSTRPTAVNLFWALDRMEREALRQSERGPERITEYLLKEARAIHQEDVEMNRAMGLAGAPLVPESANILTHCNAGALATGGHGTALGVIRSAVAQRKKIHVWVDETRPLLQGARLTAWELTQDRIPCTLITDSMAASLFAAGRVDLVITGADRVAANGDIANKIGTFNLAVLAHHFGVPFYVAAPASTVDLETKCGADIVIEQRSEEELRTFAGQVVAPPKVAVYNPAFDVTPARYLTALITDRGVIHPPFGPNLQGTFGRS